MSLPKGAIDRRLNSNDVMKTPFIMFQAHADDYYDMSQKSLNAVQKESILSKVFFSPQNIEIIQKRIIIRVLKETDGKYLIEKQEEADLQIVMRSIFLQHAKHSPSNIREQVGELNDIVVDEVVPGIVSELKSYFGYLKDVFGERQIMDRPENVSNTGHKSLPSVTRRFEF